MDKRKTAKRTGKSPASVPAGWWLGPLFAAGLFLLFSAVLALAVCRWDIPPDYLPLWATGLGAAACFCAGALAAALAGSKGLLRGVLAGGSLFLLVLALGFFFYGQGQLTELSPLRLGAFLLFGAAGGYLGILHAEKKRRIRPS